MPTISMFYGVLVSMYFMDTSEHHMPHIHVYYQDFEAVFAIPSAEQLADALLWLRTAVRVTVRLGSFSARTFGELERHAKGIAWASIVPKGGAVHFRVTSKKSKLYHEDGIAERLERALTDRRPLVVRELAHLARVALAHPSEQRRASIALHVAPVLVREFVCSPQSFLLGGLPVCVQQ